MRRISIIATVGLLILSAGCSSTPPDVASGITTVTVTVTPAADGSGSVSTHHLVCDPPFGDYIDPTTACATLKSVDINVFSPVPVGSVCTAIYGGPEKAVVNGTVNGRIVKSTFSRENGCEIARWNAIKGILMEPTFQDSVPTETPSRF